MQAYRSGTVKGQQAAIRSSMGRNRKEITINIMAIKFTLVALMLAGSTLAYSILPRTQVAMRPRALPSRLHSTKNKGFGNNASEPKKKTADKYEDQQSVVSSRDSVIQQESIVNNAPARREASAAASESSSLNAGQRALNEMRRQRAEEKDSELRRVRELMQVDAGPAAIPEPVAQRMGARMLPFVGLPLFGGMGSFVAFWYLATYKNLEFEPSLVAVSTIGILVVSLLVSPWFASHFTQ